MADKTSIEWTDASWPVVTGCDHISAGCDNCYAAKLTSGRLKHLPAYEGLAEKGRFNGKVRLLPDRLNWPLKWRKARKIFVSDMADLFHKDVPDDYIAQVFAVMAVAKQHTFQLLSKRHARMRSLLTSQEFQHAVARAVDALTVEQEHDPKERWADIPRFDGYHASTHGNLRGPNGPLAAYPNPRSGRLTVTLWNTGAPSTQYVHRLVLAAHSPTDDSSLEACHRNGDKTDNRLANLRWGTRSENQQEKVRHGSRGGPQKLTQAQVEEIRQARKAGRTQQSVADQFGVSRPLISMIENGRAWAGPDLLWPLPNVWLGVSVEDQKHADIRIPALLETPAAVRFLSCEPLLGPVDLRNLTVRNGALIDCLGGDVKSASDGAVYTGTPSVIDWTIVGGESGPGARPMSPDWARHLRDQCVSAGVPYFFKQWGSWAPSGWHGIGRPLPGSVLVGDEVDAAGHRIEMARVGKKAAGRVLDGRTWDQFPTVTSQEVASRG